MRGMYWRTSGWPRMIGLSSSASPWSLQSTVCTPVLGSRVNLRVRKIIMIMMMSKKLIIMIMMMSKKLIMMIMIMSKKLIMMIMILMMTYLVLKSISLQVAGVGGMMVPLCL